MGGMSLPVDWPLHALYPPGVRGVSIEPWLLSTLSQDVAGATPVAAWGDQVGRPYSRLGGGYHPLQSVSTKRPRYARRPRGGVRNFALLQTKDLTAAPWSATNASIVADGTLGGDPAFAITDASAAAYGALSQAVSGLSGALCFSCKIKKTSGALSAAGFRINWNDGANRAAGMMINSNTGTLVSTSYWTDGGAVRLPVVDGGDHWLVGVAFTLPAGTASQSVAFFPAHVLLSGADSAANTGAMTVAAPQLEPGSVRTAHQVVGEAWDITEAGQPSVPELLFDGSDDHLIASAIPWATDEVTIIAAVRKMSDTTIGMVCELSPSTDSNNGTFFLAGPRDPNTANYGVRSKGTAIAQVSSAASFAAPRCDILVAQGKIGSDTCSLSVNGGAPVTVATDQGSGVFGTFDLYLGARGGSSLFGKLGLGGFFAVNWFPPAGVAARAARHLAGQTGGIYP